MWAIGGLPALPVAGCRGGPAQLHCRAYPTQIGANLGALTARVNDPNTGLGQVDNGVASDG